MWSGDFLNTDHLRLKVHNGAIFPNEIFSLHLREENAPFFKFTASPIVVRFIAEPRRLQFPFNPVNIVVGLPNSMSALL